MSKNSKRKLSEVEGEESVSSKQKQPRNHHAMRDKKPEMDQHMEQRQLRQTRDDIRVMVDTPDTPDQQQQQQSTPQTICPTESEKPIENVTELLNSSAVDRYLQTLVCKITI